MPKTAKLRETKSRVKACAKKSPPHCPLVIIGASAGGLEVFQKFFDNISSTTGISFVLVQHLDPNHETLMPQLLAKHTKMRVMKVRDGQKLRANYVYVIPPNANLSLEKCTLRLAPKKKNGKTPAIDLFFRSAAEAQSENVIGIVLSGIGSDGTLGLKSIKEHGGLTMAQSLETARFDSMPRSAISTGLVDYILPVEEMPAKIVEYLKHLKLFQQRKGTQSVQEEALKYLPKITSALRSQTGNDFSRYKQSTLIRRIQRRMQMQYVDTVADYVQLLHENAKEVENLFKDLLIGVTQFFRDIDAFESLAREVIPKILRDKGEGSEVRIWIPGCATGEEAFSIAILLAEQMEKSKKVRKVRIFASDLDAEALDFARKARFKNEIAEQVSARRLSRFFIKRGERFEVIEAIREMCVFSPHNLLKDPPFSRLDLVSCRNLLIYLEADLQKRLLPLFHYALNPGGFLFLGPSENIASRSELFRPLDKKSRIFQRKPCVLRSPVDVPLLDAGKLNRMQPFAAPQFTVPKEQNIARTIERVVLEDYAPASVIINEQGEVMYFSGRTGRFLDQPSGAPSNKIVNMARKNLRLELRTAVHRAVAARCEVVRENIPVRSGKDILMINLVVRPLTELGKEAGLFIVIFQEIVAGAFPAKPPAEDILQKENSIVQQLENELRSTKEDLQTTIEELETSNEELKSANEELLSMNEELQSTNEELQTSKEELQSTNEELQRKIEEVDSANNDLLNFFQSTQVATIFVDAHLRIGKFTPALAQIFRISERDIGRGLLDVVSELAVGNLPADIAAVIKTHVPNGGEINLCGNQWFIMRITPYRTTKQMTRGAVITFTNITEMKRSSAQRNQLAAIVESSQDAIYGTSLNGKIISWNGGAERVYGYSAEEALGKTLSLVVPDDRAKEIDPIRKKLQEGELVESLETIRKTKDGRLIDVSLRVSAIYDDRKQIVGFASIARDITPNKIIERELRRSEKLLSDFFENGAVGLHWVGSDGTILRANQTELELLGYSSDEYVGQNITAFHVDEPVIHDILKRLTCGETLNGYEARLRCKDGGIKTVLISSNVLFEGDQFVHTRCFTRDITEQKRNLEELRRSEQIYRAIGESINYGIWMCDAAGRNTYASPSFLKLVGMTQEECSEFGWGRVLHPDDAERTMKAWKERATTGDFWNIEHRFLGVDGNYHPILARGVPIKDDNGKVICWAGINLDISEQKITEAALRDSQQKLAVHAEELEVEVSQRTAHLKDTVQSLEGVCYTIAHDLRAPLRAVQGFTKILQEDYSPSFDDHGKDFANRIVAAAVRMDVLIKDLLDYARLSHVDLPNIRLNLDAHIQQALDLLADEIRLKGAKIRVKPLPAVMGNETMLQQIFSNLLGNALKFVKPNTVPSIEIWGETTGLIVKLFIKDNGIGIAPEYHDRIFELFQRLHDDQVYPGTGVGLAIVKKGIQRMGGRVTLESPLDGGTCFCLEFQVGDKTKDS